MAKAIGPNFQNELALYQKLNPPIVLIGAPFSWSSDGMITFGSGMSDGQKTAVNAVYAAHNPATPDPNAAANTLIASGIALTSTGTPSLNATYGCDQANITALQVAALSGGFPNPFSYPDIGGAPHVMTQANFTAFAAAVGTFLVAVAAARTVALAGGTWVPPSNAFTIP